jgi:hypothetical protein
VLEYCVQFWGSTGAGLRVCFAPMDCGRCQREARSGQIDNDGFGFDTTHFDPEDWLIRAAMPPATGRRS